MEKCTPWEYWYRLHEHCVVFWLCSLVEYFASIGHFHTQETIAFVVQPLPKFFPTCYNEKKSNFPLLDLQKFFCISWIGIVLIDEDRLLQGHWHTCDIHRNHPHSLEAWHNLLSPFHYHSTISPCFLTNIGISNILPKDKSYRSRFILIFCKQSFPPAVFAALLGYVISQQALKCFSSIRKSSVMHRIWGWNTCWSLSYSFTKRNPKKKNTVPDHLLAQPYHQLF